MLFGRRRRLLEVAKEEAEGRSFWTNQLDQQARIKLVHAVKNLKEESWRNGHGVNLIGVACQLTLEELGKTRLSTRPTRDLSEDCLYSILESDESTVFSVIEALMSMDWSIRQRFPDVYAQTIGDFMRGIPEFTRRVRTILREHRVNFDLIEGRFIPRDSSAMHESVVIPTLTLLGSQASFKRVETAYQDALRELHNGTPDDAITDVATALQEAFVTLGCKGNSLGPLVRSAMDKGVISPYDKKLVDWVSADRSNKGDAHSVAPTSREDAWLAVHVVGALILRIARGPLRSPTNQRSDSTSQS